MVPVLCITRSNKLKVDSRNENFLFETTSHRALIFGIKYHLVASSAKFFFKFIPRDQKWPCPGGYMFSIGLYREKSNILI